MKTLSESSVQLTAKGFTLSGCGPASLSFKVLGEGDLRKFLGLPELSCPNQRGIARKKGRGLPTWLSNTYSWKGPPGSVWSLLCEDRIWDCISEHLILWECNRSCHLSTVTGLHVGLCFWTGQFPGQNFPAAGSLSDETFPWSIALFFPIWTDSS